MFLTHDHLVELTGKLKHAAQIRALALMQVSYLVRPDGSPAVLEKHLDKILDAAIRSKVGRQILPDWNKVK